MSNYWFYWDTTFLNTNVKEKVSISSNTILNILSNFIPHKTVVSDDNGFKYLIKKKEDIFKKYRKNNYNIHLLQCLRFFQEDLNSFINVTKQNYTWECQLNLLNFIKARKHTGVESNTENIIGNLNQYCTPTSINNNAIKATSQKHLRAILVTLKLLLFRPHHDYGDILYGRVHNAWFHQQLESFQYNAYLANTGAICASSSEKLY